MMDRARFAGLLLFVLSLCIPAFAYANSDDPDKDRLKQARKAAKAEKEKQVSDYFAKLRAVCSGPKVKKPAGALKAHRDEMLEKYGFFINTGGTYGDEDEIFRQCSSPEAIDRYFEIFWSIRDSDEATPENEYKQEIDKRISQINNEPFYGDIDTPGLTFRAHGGLKSDLALVYLLRGAPDRKVMVSGKYLADLMAWLYFDAGGRPLYVFLFYDKGYNYQVFRRHMVMETWEAYLEVLRELAKSYPASENDYLNLLNELRMMFSQDPEGIIYFAIFRFSYYDKIKIDKVLAPPSPDAITAEALQPLILGIPDLPPGVKIIANPYSSTIPGFFRFIKSRDGIVVSAMFNISPLSVDWRDNGTVIESEGVKEPVFEADFDVLISFTNEATGDKTEFASGMHVTMKQSKMDSVRGQYLPFNIGAVRIATPGPMSGKTVSEVAKTLKPGEYEVKIRLIDQLTFKSGEWFDHITVK